MNTFQSLFRTARRQSFCSHRPSNRLRAQLLLEGLESPLVPTNLPMVPLPIPPIGGLAPTPVFVVPVTQPVDSTHVHSLVEAVQAAGDNGLVVIEPGASPDYLQPVTVAHNGLVIEGDPNVPPTTLPREEINLTGHDNAFLNLNLSILTLGTSPGDTGTFRNHVSNCLIHRLFELGTGSTFSQNTITSDAILQGAAPNVFNGDQITNNLFTSEANPQLEILRCDGVNISHNTFYAGGGNNVIFMLNSGEANGYCTIANNAITTFGSVSTGIQVLQQGTGIADVRILNNTIHTNGGTGLALSCQVGFDLFALVQGNDFHTDAVGVSISGDANGTCGTIDLGGGSLASLGGNDFRSFTAQGTTSNAAILVTSTSSSTVISATGNIFHDGVSPAFVVDDGVQGSVTGTGQINVSAALDNVHGYVQALYNDLLGRTGTMAELNMWVSIFNTQGQSAVANGILRSSESLGRIVDGFYLRFLGRNADPAGRAAWVSILQHGATLESVEQGFITSPEYLGHINTDFVQSLYINLLGRTGSAAELAAWNNNIQSLGLAGIANGFLMSQEYRADNVSTDFASFLHRPPSPTETSSYVGMATDLLGIEALVLGSQECFAQI